VTAPSAWTISTAMAAAQSALSRLEASGDVDTDEAAALAVLREDAPDIDVVIGRLLRAMGEAQGNTVAADTRIDALELRRDRYTHQANEYRRTVFSILDALGLAKWKSAEFTVSLSPSRPGVVITDADALPDALCRVTRTPDKLAIKAALEQGEVIAGAEMQNSMPQMRVLTK